MRFKQLQRFLRDFRLLWSALKKFNDDNGFFLSSGIAFNILINLIPFVLLMLALVGTYLYSDQEVLDHIRAYLGNVAPTLDPKIMGSFLDLIENRRMLGTLGFIGLIWFSTWVFGSLRIALNIVSREEKGRGMFHGIAIDLLMIILAGVLLFLSMMLSSAITILQADPGQVSVTIGLTLRWILKYLLPLFLTCCVFFLIYKIIPKKKVRLLSTLQASLFAGLLWELAKHFFSWYVVHLARYSLFYGSLSTLVIIVLWIYYSSAILIVGAEFAYFLEENRQTSAV
ncbi:MAG: YihY/virulence factor BrkB family protein [Acidobacteria bacterium]|nr:YihY/virulence factor BrkB family protein [Acidobacteriota bacterium]